MLFETPPHLRAYDHRGTSTAMRWLPVIPVQVPNLACIFHPIILYFLLKKRYYPGPHGSLLRHSVNKTVLSLILFVFTCIFNKYTCDLQGAYKTAVGLRTGNVDTHAIQCRYLYLES